MKLSSKELAVLANGYDSEFWRIFRKHLMEDRQMELAQLAPFAAEMKQVHVLQGQITELRHIEKEMSRLKKEQAKREKTK